jgi:Mn2+/Fe2+ NRAMP family transporter
VDILQQMIDVVYGTKVYLPETKIVLGIVLGLALLIYLKGPLGGLVTSVLVTVLVGQSYFSQGDINQLSTERVVAGVILGLILFFTNLYFLVRTIADWKD